MTRLTERISGSATRALVSGSAKVLVVRMAGGALALALQVVLARVLGVTQYGIYVYAFSWLVILAIIARLGMDTGTTRLVAQYRVQNDAAHLRGVLHWSTRNTTILSLVFALLAASVVFALSGTLKPEQQTTLYFAFLALPFLSLTMVRQGALRGFRRVVAADFPDIILRPIFILLTVLLFVSIGYSIHASTAMLITLIAYFLAFVLGSWWLTKTVHEEVQASAPRSLASEWWSISIPLIFLQSMQLILNRLDVLMLGALVGPDSVGIYAAATRICELAIFGLIIVNPIVAPLISELYHSSRQKELQRIVVLAARITTSITILVAGVLFVFGDQLLGLFGAGFDRGYQALLILLSGQIINAMAGSVAFLLTMTGHQNRAAKILGVAAVLNIVLNFVLIPSYGIVGAAIATAASTAAWNIAMVIYARKELGIRSTVV